MKTLRKVEIKPEYVNMMPLIDDMEENTLYISEEYGVAIHRCLCGCGSPTITPLGSHGWSITEKEGKVSMVPSIGNFNFPCRSHYIITKNIANFV